MRSVTSRNTPIDRPDFESIEHMWEGPDIQPKVLPESTEAAEAPSSGFSVEGRIHLRGPGAEVDIIGHDRVLRIEVSRGADAEVVRQFLNRFADSTSPLWSLARSLSLALDVAVDGARVAYFDSSSGHTETAMTELTQEPRPGTDRRLDADEPYGDLTYLDPNQLPPPENAP